MVGRLSGLTLNRDGSQNITVTIQSDFREKYDELADSDVNVEIKKVSKRRSLEANSYLWVLCDEIAKVSSKYSTDGKNEIYREAVRAKGLWQEVFIRVDAVQKFLNDWAEHGIGWFADVMDEFRGKNGDIYKQLHVYSGSSTYSSLEMSRIIDYVVMIANDLGIPTITQKEKERMLGNWAKKKKEAA